MKKIIFGVFLVGIILTIGGWKVFAEETAGGTELKQGQQAFSHKNYPETFKWFHQAAEKGNLTAESFLGYLYVVGLGVEKNPKEGFKWLKQAAEAGNADAQYNLGYMYRFDPGVGKNDGEAFKWYLKAAEQDQVEAQVAVGFMYKTGTGVEQSLESARDWFYKAAQAGNEIALTQLGYDWGDNDPGSNKGRHRTKGNQTLLKQEAGYIAPGYSPGSGSRSGRHPSSPRSGR